MNKLYYKIPIGIFVFFLISVFLFTDNVLTGNVVYEINQNTSLISEDISVTQAKDLIKNTEIKIIDVRTTQEYNSNRILDSINIDYYSYNFKEELSKLDKDETYLLYCQSGRRSNNAKKIMQELGFKKIYNLNEGINSWNKYDCC
jgi:phage shock protein E